MKIDSLDFNLGIIVNTPEGKGSVEVVDRLNNKVKVKFSKSRQVAIKEYTFSDLSLDIGQIRPSFSFQIGEYILMFQKFENRLKDYFNYCYALSEVQKKEFSSDFTAGKLLSKINNIIMNYGDKTTKNRWTKINTQALVLKKLRDKVIHGYAYSLNDSLETDYNSICFTNSKGGVEFLNYYKIIEYSNSLSDIYNNTHKLFRETAEQIKGEIKKVNKKKTNN